MTKTIFERKFEQNLRRVNRRLKAYLADPENEENIHDIRTSIRRMDATFSLLPKKIRKQYRGNIKSYRELLRANSKARDYDIIIGRLKILQASGMEAELNGKKKTVLARAVKLTRSLDKLPQLQLGPADEERLAKISGRLVKRISELIPIVLSDGSKVDELHRMRRNFRELRYTLDVVPPEIRKKYKDSVHKVIGRGVVFRELQDALGSIHDCDITIEYLRSMNANQILEKEINNRRRFYEKFVKYVNDTK